MYYYKIAIFTANLLFVVSFWWSNFTIFTPSKMLPKILQLTQHSCSGPTYTYYHPCFKPSTKHTYFTPHSSFLNPKATPSSARTAKHTNKPNEKATEGTTPIPPSNSTLPTRLPPRTAPGGWPLKHSVTYKVKLVVEGDCRARHQGVSRSLVPSRGKIPGVASV